MRVEFKAGMMVNFVVAIMIDIRFRIRIMISGVCNVTVCVIFKVIVRIRFGFG